jgi:hypothetical protein
VDEQVVIYCCSACRRREEFMRRYFCAVCKDKLPKGDYQATKEAWVAAGLQPQDFACWLCFVARLGRKPTITDLVDCPANAPILWALREAANG